MYKYIKASKQLDLKDLNKSGDDYSTTLEDEAGDLLKLEITEWSNGWDWLLKDSKNYMIAYSEGLTWDTPQDALDDFNDWVDSNR